MYYIKTYQNSIIIITIIVFIIILFIIIYYYHYYYVWPYWLVIWCLGTTQAIIHTEIHSKSKTSRDDTNLNRLF